MPVTPGLVAEHLVERAVPADRDLAGLFLGKQLVLQDFFAAQLVAPMHQGDVTGDVRQVKRLLDRRVAAADDGDRLVAVEETVAGGAGGNAATGIRFLGRQAQILGRSTGGDDQCVAGIGGRIADQTNGFSVSRAVWMWSKTISVSKRRACSSKRCISSGPCTPCASAGQLSTSVVVISWPPWAMPVISTGLRLARAA
jgi:hypothetical protein